MNYIEKHICIKVYDWIYDYMIHLHLWLFIFACSLILELLDHSLFGYISRHLKQLLLEGTLNQTQKAWLWQYLSPCQWARLWLSGFLISVQIPKMGCLRLFMSSHSVFLCVSCWCLLSLRRTGRDFPGSGVDRNRPANAGGKGKWKSLSPVRLFVTPWIIQSMEFSRPDYWSG